MNGKIYIHGLIWYIPEHIDEYIKDLIINSDYYCIKCQNEYYAVEYFTGENKCKICNHKNIELEECFRKLKYAYKLASKIINSEIINPSFRTQLVLNPKINRFKFKDNIIDEIDDIIIHLEKTILEL